jgi:menaquinone-dependent protoporphyrinogen IX oxidase
MKILIVYYSRTGLTKKVATSISTALNAKGFSTNKGSTVDLDEIIDAKKRSGAIGYVKAGKDAMQNKLTKIAYVNNPKEYDLVIIGGPVWAWTVTPAVRTYIDKNIDTLKTKKIAFFATQGSSGAEKKFEAMEQMLKIKPLVTLIVNGKDFKGNAYLKKIDSFVESIHQ